MKNIKILLAVFTISILTSSIGVFAYSTGNAYISNVKVGGADNSIYSSGARTKVTSGNQTLSNISQSRALKARLGYWNTALNEWKNGTLVWQNMKNGQTLTFNSDGVTGFYPSLMLGDYKAEIAQVSWGISDATLYSGTYSPGN